MMLECNGYSQSSESLQSPLTPARLDVENASQQDLLELAAKYSFGGRIDAQNQDGPIFTWGRGSVLRDLTGREYLDFNSGQMCAALGHNHPTITKAIVSACEELIHSHSSYFNLREIELAARLAALFPEPLRKSLFSDSGADANELAITIARVYTGGQDVFSPHTSYHGLSLGTRSVTFAGWRSGHGALPSNSYAIFAPYCYRCPLKASYPSCDFACVDASFDLIDAQAVGQPAALITEPLFSAGGVIDPPEGWLTNVASFCKARDMLLIVDEEQTGLGKLGTMFGFERDGVVPDIVTTAKHLGGGLAISAVTVSDDIESTVVECGLTVTRSHSNDPLPCAAGTASLDIIEDEDVVTVARAIGEHMLRRLNELAERYALIGDVRGRGLLTGIELITDTDSRAPDYETGSRIHELCFDNGFLLSKRRGGSVLRFVPPASTTVEQVDAGMDILAKALEGVYG